MDALSSWGYYGKENNAMRLCCACPNVEKIIWRAFLLIYSIIIYVMGKGFDYLW